MKLKKWSPFKEILFIYLAVNKIMYWFNNFAEMEQINLASGGEMIFNRLMNQDLVLISSIIFLYYLDWRFQKKNTKYNVVVEHIILYGIGFIFFIGMMFGLNAYFIVFVEGLSWSEYVSLFLEVIPMFAFGYIVVIIALEIKLYFKGKGKRTSEEPVRLGSMEDKIGLLKVLLDDGILSQEEFDKKKKMLLSA